MIAAVDQDRPRTPAVAEDPPRMPAVADDQPRGLQSPGSGPGCLQLSLRSGPVLQFRYCAARTVC